MITPGRRSVLHDERALWPRSGSGAASDASGWRDLSDAGKVVVGQADLGGQLDPAWDPADILVFVSQIATSWAIQTDLAPTGEERDAFMAARRAAIVAAVQRLFPSALAP